MGMSISYTMVDGLYNIPLDAEQYSRYQQNCGKDKYDLTFIRFSAKICSFFLWARKQKRLVLNTISP